MSKRSFEALDAMRGIAALAVVALHAGTLFGRVVAPSGYLAVDLFFAMSGYVLAHAYDGRGLGAAAFMRLRLIRLWPLYLLGLGLATVQALGLLALGPRSFNYLDILGSAGLNAFYLPSGFAGPSPGALFPLNGPAWSLFFEIVINVAFCTAVFRSPRALLSLLIASGAALVATGLLRGNLDYGWAWSHAYCGLARVCWSFTVGVLLRRHVAAPALSKSPWIGVAAFLGLGVALMFDPGRFRAAYDLAFVLLASPALVWLASGLTFGPAASRVCLTLGSASYALYAIHRPLAEAAVFATRGLHHVPPIMVGVGFMAAMLALSVALDRWFDRPMRLWLVGAWPPPGSAKVRATA